MTKDRLQEALTYIHKAELKYGSISNTPSDDPNLLKVQHIMGVDKEPENKVYEFDDVDEKIKELINYGYSANAIYQVLGVNQLKVQRVRDFCHLKYKPIFKYQLTLGEYTAYTPFVRGMCTIAHIARKGYSAEIMQKVLDLGYEIKPIALYWGDLPENAIYVTRDTGLMQKHGIDSYLKDEYGK